MQRSKFPKSHATKNMPMGSERRNDLLPYLSELWYYHLEFF